MGFTSRRGPQFTAGRQRGDPILHKDACRNIIVLVIMGTVSCLVWLPRFVYIQGCRLISVHLTLVSYVPRLFVTI
jgi:hypothetical protein